MRWLDFEHEIRDLVEEFGYTGISTPPSGDYGVDVLAEKKNRKVVIQCKLYGKGNIGGDHIMKLVGSKDFFKATDAICFTTSRFTKQAREIASKSNVHLVDRDILLGLCKGSKLTIPSLTYLVRPDDVQNTRFETANAVMRIGRSGDNELVLNDLHVSKKHAVVMRHRLKLSIQDCGSTNGTFVNEKKIVESVVLNYGDRIKINGFEFVVALCTPLRAFW